MWRLLMRVKKRIMVFSLVPEPTRRTIQHLKDYPVFQAFFFDFRTYCSRSSRYASAHRAELHDSCRACARVETSKAPVPGYEPQKRDLYLDTNELLRGRSNTRWASNRKMKNELRRARMSSSSNYYAGGTDARLHRPRARSMLRASLFLLRFCYGFFFIVFVYARAKVGCYRFFNFDLRKKLCFVKADREGKIAFWRCFVHFSTARAKLKIL